jgi:hypothetical protein
VEPGPVEQKKVMSLSVKPLDPEAPKVCAVCGQYLVKVQDRGVTEPVWVHGSLRREDHPVVLVELGGVTATGRCDFCGVDDPQFVVPTGTYVTVVMVPGEDHLMEGDWSACERCASLVAHDMWARLASRATAMKVRRDGPFPEDVAEALEVYTTRLFAGVRAHKSGPVRLAVNEDAA